MGPHTQKIVNELNSQRFIKWLESLTRINNLIPDPFFDCGGLHLIEKMVF